MQRKLLLCSALVAVAWGTSSLAATINVPADYTTIQAAINAAADGDVISIADGTYNESLDIIDKSLTLQGQSEAGTIIDASGSTDYSIDARTTDADPDAYVFMNFTLEGNLVGTYGLKVSGENATTTISNVTVQDSKRTAVDLNGLAGGSLTDVTATGVPSGNGIALTDCDNFTLSNLTTSGNAWGGLAIYTWGRYYNGGSSNVVLVSGGNSFGDSPEVYTEVGNYNDPPNPYPITGLSVSTADYPVEVGGLPTANHTYFELDEATGLATIAGSGLQTQAWLLDRVSGEYIVDPASGMFFGPAIAVAPDGSTIECYAGTVEEQLHITKDLTVKGAGKSATTIQSPVSLTESFGTSPSNYPIVFVDGADDVTIRDLTVDGLGRGNANYRFQGIGFWNSGGAVLDCDVTGIRETPLNGNQHGVAIYAYNNTGGPYDLEVGGCDIDDFQKNAFALSGTGLTVDVHDCTMAGEGDSNNIAQNGLQISYGPDGTVSNCTISDLRWVPATYVSSGMLIYQAGTVDVSGITIDDVQAPIYWFETDGSLADYDIDGGDFDGVFIYNNTTSLVEANRHTPSPLIEDGYTGDETGPIASSYAVSVLGGCLQGTGIPGSSGIWVSSSGGPLTVNVSNANISGYDYGVVADGAATTLNVTNSSLSGNLSAGYENSLSGAAQDASNNWWGDVSGPSGDGAGSGDAVVGGNVGFTPFLASGASSTTCAFTTTGTNEVTPVNSTGACANATQPCLTIDVDVSRVESSHMRGYSVDILLTDLTLCNGVASITQGSYLNSIGGTAFQVLDNGGGSYTVDCAILGTPCGQTAATGTLFNVDVTGADGTGTVAVTDVTFRDCSNAPIAGSPGAPLSITVDTVGPAAVTDLATAQVTSGNDGDGTTAVTVNFTLPGDAVAADTEVYRAPYEDTVGMNAYPEYDDVAGGAPAAPTTYPPGGPWALTSVLNDGDTDEVGDRGYWYYVIYTKDACGNWSDPSALTDGVLNYHLGDVTNGSTNGVGNNLVNTTDVSLLGANYGITLALNDPLNYLDVGPTDDFSVDGFPLTDNLVQFEDLILFAINFGQVSLTDPLENAIDLAPKGDEVPTLVLHPAAVMADGTLSARLVLSQVDQVQGVHAKVDYDASAFELIGVEPGRLVDSQNVAVFFDTIESEGSVSVDAAALGTGSTIHGSGHYATLRFRAIGEISPLRLAEVSLRDTQNRELTSPTDEIESASDDVRNQPSSPSFESRDLPTTTMLLGASPNPFQSSTSIRFQLAEASPVRVDVFDVSGRLVRSLRNGTLPAGTHAVTWDGRTVQGSSADTGIYLYRVQVGSKSWSSKLVLDR